MEFYFSGFFRGISIHIFDLYNFRNVFNNFNNSIKLITFNDVNELLLEEFIKSNITFFLELRILIKVLFHLNSQHMNKMLSS